MREVGMKLPPKESAQGQGPFVHVDDEVVVSRVVVL